MSTKIRKIWDNMKRSLNINEVDNNKKQKQEQQESHLIEINGIIESIKTECSKKRRDYDSICAGVKQLNGLVTESDIDNLQLEENLFSLLQKLLTNGVVAGSSDIFENSIIKNYLINHFKKIPSEEKITTLGKVLKLNRKNTTPQIVNIFMRLFTVCSLEEKSVIIIQLKKIFNSGMPKILEFIQNVKIEDAPYTELPNTSIFAEKKRRLDEIEKNITLLNNESLKNLFKIINRIEHDSKGHDELIFNAIASISIAKDTDTVLAGKILNDLFVEFIKLSQSSAIELLEHSILQKYLLSEQSALLNTFREILIAKIYPIIDFILQKNSILSMITNHISRTPIDEVINYFSLALKIKKAELFIIFRQPDVLINIHTALNEIIDKKSKFFEFDNFDSFIAKSLFDPSRNRSMVFKQIIHPFFTENMLAKISNDKNKATCLELLATAKQKATSEVSSQTSEQQSSHVITTSLSQSYQSNTAPVFFESGLSTYQNVKDDFSSVEDVEKLFDEYDAQQSTSLEFGQT